MAPRIALCIQGDGQGHYTQALAIRTSLREHLGWEVHAIVLNSLLADRAPCHFTQSFQNTPCLKVKGPIGVRDAKGAIDALGSAAQLVVRMLPDYAPGVAQMDAFFEAERIEVVVNLLDMMAVWYMMYARSPRAARMRHVHVATHFKFRIPSSPAYGRKQVALAHRALQVLYPVVTSVHRGNFDIFLSAHTPVTWNCKDMPGIIQSPRYAQVALCPFPPSRQHAALLEGGAIKLKQRPSFLGIAHLPSEFVLPCFVSRAELSQLIRPAASVIETWSRHPPGTIRLVAYVNHPDLKEGILHFCRRYSGGLPFHVYLFTQQAGDVWPVHERLTCLRLSRGNFLSLLAEADGLVSTAGVESICEAIVLHKPAYLVPAAGNPEQFLNAEYFAQHMEGILAGETFDFTELLQYVHRRPGGGGTRSTYAAECDAVAEWLEKASYMFAQSMKLFVES